MELKVINEEGFMDKFREKVNQVKATYDYYDGKRSNKLGNLKLATDDEVAQHPDAQAIVQAFNAAGRKVSQMIDRNKKALLIRFPAAETPKTISNEFKKGGKYAKYLNSYDPSNRTADLIFNLDDDDEDSVEESVMTPVPTPYKTEDHTVDKDGKVISRKRNSESLKLRLNISEAINPQEVVFTNENGKVVKTDLGYTVIDNDGNYVGSVDAKNNDEAVTNYIDGKITEGKDPRKSYGEKVAKELGNPKATLIKIFQNEINNDEKSSDEDLQTRFMNQMADKGMSPEDQMDVLRSLDFDERKVTLIPKASLTSSLKESDDVSDMDLEVIKIINNVYKDKGEIESDESVKEIERRANEKGLSLDADYLGDMIVKSQEMIDAGIGESLKESRPPMYTYDIPHTLNDREKEIADKYKLTYHYFPEHDITSVVGSNKEDIVSFSQESGIDIDTRQIETESLKESRILREPIEGSETKGDVGYLDFDLIKKYDGWISIEGEYKDDKYGYIGIHGRTQFVADDKTKVYLSAVSSRTIPYTTSVFNEVIDTDWDTWQQDVIDTVKDNYPRMIDEVKSKLDSKSVKEVKESVDEDDYKYYKVEIFNDYGGPEDGIVMSQYISYEKAKSPEDLDQQMRDADVDGWNILGEVSKEEYDKHHLDDDFFFGLEEDYTPEKEWKRANDPQSPEAMYRRYPYLIQQKFLRNGERWLLKKYNLNSKRYSPIRTFDTLDDAKAEADKSRVFKSESLDDVSIDKVDELIRHVKNEFPGSEAIYDGDTHTIKITLDDKIEESSKKKVSFKDSHICKGCGNPLSKCTCDVQEEDVDLNKLDESLFVDRTAPGRVVDPGINWIWYSTDTEEDAKKWFKELTGSDADYDWIIQKADDTGKYEFRLRRDFKKSSDSESLKESPLVATAPSISDLKAYFNSSDTLKDQYANFFEWFDEMARQGKINLGFANHWFEELSATQPSSIGQHKRDAIDVIAKVNDELVNLTEGDSMDEWIEVETKSVTDADGMVTDYTLYKNEDGTKFVTVFGDKDIYRPEDGDFDWEGDDEDTAHEWFDDYKGISDED